MNMHIKEKVYLVILKEIMLSLKFQICVCVVKIHK
jgi:hypothetical protein